MFSILKAINEAVVRDIKLDTYYVLDGKTLGVSFHSTNGIQFNVVRTRAIATKNGDVIALGSVKRVKVADDADFKSFRVSKDIKETFRDKRANTEQQISRSTETNKFHNTIIKFKETIYYVAGGDLVGDKDEYLNHYTDTLLYGKDGKALEVTVRGHKGDLAKYVRASKGSSRKLVAFKTGAEDDAGIKWTMSELDRLVKDQVVTITGK